MSPPAVCCNSAPDFEAPTNKVKETPACCPKGSWPQLLRSKEQLNDDNIPAPKGSIETVYTEGEDLPIYFVEPTKKSIGALMVIPDIYTVRVLSQDSRSGDRIGSICDALAEKGYTVALPSIFRDKPYDKAVSSPDDGDFIKFDCFGQDGGVAWFQSQNYEKVGPDVKACAKFLSEKTGGQPLGVVGFCYGTWLLSKASAVGDVDFKCAVGCHPATTLETAVFGKDEIAMLKDLAMPTMFFRAGNDSDVYTADGEGKAALEMTGGGVVEFPDMLHGWVSRGDVSDEKVKRDVTKAIDLMMNFLDENMAESA